MLASAWTMIVWLSFLKNKISQANPTIQADFVDDEGVDSHVGDTDFDDDEEPEQQDTMHGRKGSLKTGNTPTAEEAFKKVAKH